MEGEGWREESLRGADWVGAEVWGEVVFKAAGLSTGEVRDCLGERALPEEVGRELVEGI